MIASEIEEILATIEHTGGNITEAAKILNIPRSTLRDRISQITSAGNEVIAETIKLSRKNQRLQDITRIERKTFRDHARAENAITEYTQELIGVLKEHKFKTHKAKKTPKGRASGVVHWSDHHLNERVSLSSNKFDWNIASQRLKKHVEAVKMYGKACGVGSILVAFTGDLMNSDRRIDEMLANAGNRAKASVLAVDLYQQALLDLAKDFDITVAGISGNESRIPKDVGWLDEIASDNFDFTIGEHLRMLLDNRMAFVKPDDPSELVVNIAGQNILLIHGHSKIGKNDTQKAVQGVLGEYAASGIVIDMVIFGHYHESAIADIYARSSSLCGTNSYSKNALGYYGRAAQNFYIIHEGGGFDGIKIDLQNTSEVIGYDIDDRLATYNTKSADKLERSKRVYKVVIS